MAFAVGGSSLGNNPLTYGVELEFIFAFKKELLEASFAAEHIVKSIPYDERKDLTLPIILEELPGRVYNSWGLLDNTYHPPKVVAYDDEPQLILSDLIADRNNIDVTVQTLVRGNEKTQDLYYKWHITSDPSVCGVGSQNITDRLPRARGDADNWDSYGLELVSPVLSSDEPKDRQDLSAILNTVKGSANDSHGAFITNQTGLHVHVQAPGKLEEFQELAILCIVYEDQIAKLLPPCRRPGHACSNYNTESNRLGLLFDTPFIEGNKATYSDLFQDLPGTQTIARVRAKITARKTKRKVAQFFNWPYKTTYQRYGNRNRQVNFTSAIRSAEFPKTVEFRQARGNLDAEEIGHWVDFCIGLVRLSEFYVKNPAKFPASTWDDVNVFDLMNDMKLTDDAKVYWHSQLERWEEGKEGDEDDRTDIEPVPGMSDEGNGKDSPRDDGSGANDKGETRTDNKMDEQPSRSPPLGPAFVPLPTGPYPLRGGFNGLPRYGPDRLSNTMRAAARLVFPRISAYNSPLPPSFHHIWERGQNSQSPPVLSSLIRPPLPSQPSSIGAFMLPVHPRGFIWPDVDRRILALTYGVFNDAARTVDVRHQARLAHDTLLIGDTRRARLEWLKLELLLNENMQVRRIDATMPPALTGTHDSTFYGRAVDVARMRNLIGVRGITGILAPYPEDLVNFAEVAITRWQQGELHIARLAYRESNRLMGEYHLSKAPVQNQEAKPQTSPIPPGSHPPSSDRPDPQTPDNIRPSLGVKASRYPAVDKPLDGNQATTSPQQGQSHTLEDPDDTNLSTRKKRRPSKRTPKLSKTSKPESPKKSLTMTISNLVGTLPTAIVDFEPHSSKRKHSRDGEDRTESLTSSKKQKSGKGKEEQPTKTPSSDTQTDTFVALIILYNDHVPGPISDARMNALTHIHDELDGASVDGAKLKDMVAERLRTNARELDGPVLPAIGGAQVGERRVAGTLNALSPDETHVYSPGYWYVENFNFADWTTIFSARTYRMGNRRRNNMCGFRALISSMKAQYPDSPYLQSAPGVKLMDHLITIADDVFGRHDEQRWEDELAGVLQIWTGGEFVLATGLVDGTGRRVGDQHNQQENYGRNLYVHNIDDNHWLGLKKK